MKIKFNDSPGTQETLYFNPEVEVFPDGSLIMLGTTLYYKGKSYEIPMYAGEPEQDVWIDFNRSTYDNTEQKLTPGSFKAVWRDGDTLNICRYKETTGVIEETFFRRLMRKLSA